MADVHLAKSPLPLDELTGADTATDGQVPTSDGAGGVAWEDQTGGGGGGGELLATTLYSPGTLATYTTTSDTLADVDATNLAVAFTVPASGQVIVRLHAYGDLSASTVANHGLVWGLRSGTSDVTDSFAIVQRTGSTANVGANGRVAYSCMFTGLTPGASLTWKWAFARTGTATGRILVQTGGFGQALMEVWAA